MKNPKTLYGTHNNAAIFVIKNKNGASHLTVVTFKGKNDCGVILEALEIAEVKYRNTIQDIKNGIPHGYATVAAYEKMLSDNMDVRRKLLGAMGQ